MEHSRRLIARCERLAEFLLALVITLGFIVLAGWALGNHDLTSLFPAGAKLNYVGQVHSTAAICMMLYAVSLLLIMAKNQNVRSAGYALAVIPFSTGVLNGVLELMKEDLEPFRFLQPTESAPGITFPTPMEWPIALSTTVIGLALFLYQVGIRRKNLYPTEIAAMLSIFCSVAVLMGSATSKEALCVIGRCYTPSLGYASMMLLFAIALFLSDPTRGFVSHFTSERIRGIILRRASSAVLFPLIYLFCAIPSFIFVEKGVPALNLGLCQFIAFSIFILIFGWLIHSGVKAASHLETIVDLERSRAKELAVKSEELEKELERTRFSRTSTQFGALSQTAVKYKRVCLTCMEEFEDTVNFCPSDGSDLSRIVDDSLIGNIFADKYSVIEELGSGGMSTVYKATHLLIEKTVALKVLNEKTAGSGDGLKRFIREAKAMGGLKHDNIVGIDDFGLAADGRAFLVMEYLNGESLSDVLKRGYLNLRDTTEVVSQLCDALAHAHKAGIVHRDLKPSNIMLSRGHEGGFNVKVVDFGLAKMAGDELSPAITNTGECVGSPLYMSPEQCKGDPITTRADIYALGCIMFEMLAGFPPIMERNIIETVKAHVGSKPADFPRDIVVPPEIKAIVYKCLEKEPNNRPASAQEVKRIFSGFFARA
ncbi:MAG: serine/threonine protein kinase [Cyanobacteria bacterium]|nr:serine/threonine protein kinase [Cyanobacteriota bacterium]